MASLTTLIDLPDAVIVNGILNRLPFVEAVRTCVLCRSWAHLWQSIPDLDLSEIRSNHVTTRILSLHSGDIRLFRAVAKTEVPTILHFWLALISRRLRRRSLRTLALGHFACNLNCVARYFPHLIHLHLFGWTSHWQSPAVFEPSAGLFASLRTLHLDCITLEADLSALFSACPSLEAAILKDTSLKDRNVAQIAAPNLRFLHFENVSKVSKYVISYAPLLEEFHLTEKSTCYGKSCLADCFHKATRLFKGMPNIKKLKLNKHLLEVWTVR